MQEKVTIIFKLFSKTLKLSKLSGFYRKNKSVYLIVFNCQLKISVKKKAGCHAPAFAFVIPRLTQF